MCSYHQQYGRKHILCLGQHHTFYNHCLVNYYTEYDILFVRLHISYYISSEILYVHI